MKKSLMPIPKNENEDIKQRGIKRGNLISRAKGLYERKGFTSLVYTSIRYIQELILTTAPNRCKLWYYKKFRSSDVFKFRDKEYHYLFHSYAPTWENERCVMLPIAWDLVQSFQNRGKRILEVGNVLSYVFPVNHYVIDKYEIIEGVINEDISNFKTDKKFDLILSIVTLHFVGSDTVPRNPKLVLKAIENLKNVLSPEGMMIIFHPLGEYREVDELLIKSSAVFQKQFYLMRIFGYKWKEATWEEVKDLPYNHSVPTANAVVIGIIGSDDN